MQYDQHVWAWLAARKLCRTIFPAPNGNGMATQVVPIPRRPIARQVSGKTVWLEG